MPRWAARHMPSMAPALEISSESTIPASLARGRRHRGQSPSGTHSVHFVLSDLVAVRVEGTGLDRARLEVEPAVGAPLQEIRSWFPVEATERGQANHRVGAALSGAGGRSPRRKPGGLRPAKHVDSPIRRGLAKVCQLGRRESLIQAHSRSNTRPLVVAWVLRWSGV